MSNVTLSPNRLEFSAEAIPLFVKALLTGLSMLIYVPAADQLTGLVKYVLSNLRFSDGTTAQYTGTAEELKQPLIGITGIIWAQIILGRVFDFAILNLVVAVALGLANAYFVYQVIKVILPHITTSHGSRLQFGASLEDFLKWQLVILGATVLPSIAIILLPLGTILGGLLSIVMGLVTLALYAIAYALYLRWLATQVLGGSRVASFSAQPLDIALRLMGAGLISCLIVTIPWVVLWFAKWQASQVSLPARAVADGYAL